MKIITDFIQLIFVWFAVAVWIYLIPYLIRKGWNDAEDRTKKVCDLCMRDIKKFNQWLKENEPVTELPEKKV